MSEDAPQYSPSLTPYRLIPVLQIPREDLRRGVRDTLFALHQERLRHADSGHWPSILEQIRFWEEVLGWIQTQHCETLNLVGPPE